MYLGADLETIGMSQLYGAGLKRLFGAEPSYDIRDKYISIYWKPNELKVAQDNFEKMLEPKQPGKIRIRFSDVVTTPVLKKYGPIVGLVLLSAFLLGKNS